MQVRSLGASGASEAVVVRRGGLKGGGFEGAAVTGTTPFGVTPEGPKENSRTGIKNRCSSGVCWLGRWVSSNLFPRDRVESEPFGTQDPLLHGE